MWLVPASIRSLVLHRSAMRLSAAITVAVGLIATLVASPARGQLHSELVVSGLTRPVAFVQDPTQSNVQVVVEQRGHVRVVQNGKLQEDFLDLSGVVSSN